MPSPRRPATWFTDLGHAQGLAYQRARGWSDERLRQYMALKRIAEIEYLKDAVLGRRDAEGIRRNGLRSFYKGFGADVGYDMRHPEVLTAQHRKTIRKYAKYLHTLQAQPFIKVWPRSAAERRALQNRTGQFSKRQKAFVYHTEHPEVTKVSFRKKVLREQVQVKEIILYQDYYLFEAFNRGIQPHTFTQMVRIAEKMLPVMPEGYYSLWSDLHGAIDAPFVKSRLLEKLHYYEVAYGARLGFAEGLLGFIRHANSIEADESYVGRVQERQRLAREKTEVYRERRRYLNSLSQFRTRR